MSARSEKGRRGAGVNRSGATDTTMLIWKTIDTNPGITRDEIFAKISDRIDPGYAKRRYVAKNKISGDRLLSPEILTRARRFVLSDCLIQMRRWGSVARDEHDRYQVMREIGFYNGNPDHVDETDTKAADHINRAYAERTLFAAGKRLASQYGDDAGAARLTKSETKAFLIVYGPRDNGAP